MEKLMMLQAVSEKKQRTSQKMDGSTKVFSWYEVIMTDGIDTIMGDTTEGLTNQIDSTDEKVKLNLNVGDLYNCRCTLSVVRYEKDGGIPACFQKAVFSQIVHV